MRRAFPTFRLAASRLCVLGLLTIAPVAMGCSGDGDATKKRLAKLQDEVNKLQGQQDLFEDRVAGLEAQLRAGGQSRRDEPRAPLADERPRLKVVRLGPAGGNADPDGAAQAPAAEAGPVAVATPPAEAADESAPRPVLRARGATVMEIDGDEPRAEEQGARRAPPAGVGQHGGSGRARARR